MAVMNFWEEQRKARSRTSLYVTLFIFLTIATAILIEFILRNILEEYEPPTPYFGMLFLGATFLVAGFNYVMYKQVGGGYVAESVGAVMINPNTTDLREKQLINIVQEIAVATSLPMPKVYVIPAMQINAFAAGLTSDAAAIAVSEGAFRRLKRDELQGVIAHEFGHIYNKDMIISMRLAAMVMGFFFVLYIGLRLLQFASFRDREKGINPILLSALVFIAAGALTWFLGSILKATISREREYLADACAVQFTRNPQGIANALRKIAKDNDIDMPSTGSAYAHLYIEDHTSIFATHPPIWKRIAAIEGGEYANLDLNQKEPP